MTQTIFFDVDGIILNYNRAFADFWNQGLIDNKWPGNPIDANPTTWYFGLDPAKDDMTHHEIAIQLFHETHDHLDLVHENIAHNMKLLSQYYIIEIITAYPDHNRRVANLLHHNIPYTHITCDIYDKLAHIKARELEGVHVVAIFEDGPHHLEKYLPEYGGKIWAPRLWNYLDSFKSNEEIRWYDCPEEWLSILYSSGL